MKSLLLLSAFLCSALSAAAQVYQPFPTNDAQWRARNNAGAYYSDLQYYVNGNDTFIQGTTYTKVFVRTIDIPNVPQGEKPIIQNAIATKPDEYSGAFYEQNKRIYYFAKYDTTARLYFDYNLSIGDTVHSFSIMVENTVITAIDSILVGNTYHKRYRCTQVQWTPIYHVYVTEGIGIMRSALFEYQRGQNNPYLHCFTNSQGTYTIDSFPCTYIFPYGTPTAINNTAANKPANIYPNPFSNQLTIDADAAFVKLTDAMGKVVMNEAIQTKTINTANLPSGLYILTLQDKDGNITERRKLIKE